MTSIWGAFVDWLRANQEFVERVVGVLAVALVLYLLLVYLRRQRRDTAPIRSALPSTVDPSPYRLALHRPSTLPGPLIQVFTSKTSGRVEAVVKVGGPSPPEIAASYELPTATVLVDGSRYAKIERNPGTAARDVEIPLGGDRPSKITVRFWGVDPHIDVLQDGDLIGRV